MRRFSFIYKRKYEDCLDKIEELSPLIVNLASKLTNEFRKREIEMVIGGDMAICIKTQPKYISELEINIPTTSRKEVYDFLSDPIFIDLPIKIFPKDDERLFSNQVKVNGFNFASSEYMCFLRMMSNKGDRFYYKDRDGITNILSCVKDLDKKWIRNQISLDNSYGEEKVKEWDNLVFLHT
jgi:hypothetical protein